MILLYHKVDIITPSPWWVSKPTFRRQMAALTRMRVVHLADYAPQDPHQVVITFDDGYENVHRHALPVLREHGYPFEVFVNGGLMGRWNTFDSPEPRTRFCGTEHLVEMVAARGRIQWHTAHHRDLTAVDCDEAESEIQVPEDLRRQFAPPHLSWFAYPYGAHTSAVVDRVKRHFDGAVSVLGGTDSDRFQLNRLVVREDTPLTDMGVPG